MDEGDTKTCDNCKREVPAVNFTTHAVHCARNICVCRACKEPVPRAELAQHHERLHRLLPCAQCGERVCGSDLEDHVRDSCAHTMKSCRFCALELRRGELPAHERYCGARTERCDDCGEWVMHKYRQLHLDSNHGFIRLDEDPVPTQNAIKTTNVPKPPPSSINSARLDPNPPKTNRPLTQIRYFPSTDLSVPNTTKIQNVPHSVNTGISKSQNALSTAPSTSRSQTQQPAAILNTSKIQNLSSTEPQAKAPITYLESSTTLVSDTRASALDASGPVSNLANTNTQINGQVANSSAPGESNASGVANGAAPRAKRSNHEPQVNTAAEAPDKVNKSLWCSRGAVKKRPAPKPPARVSPMEARRTFILQSVLQRLQEEEKRRREQTAHNLSVGLPPVLSAAEKLDKLRKMDALRHVDSDERDYKNILQGRVWRGAEPPDVGHVLGGARPVPGGGGPLAGGGGPLAGGGGPLAGGGGPLAGGAGPAPDAAVPRAAPGRADVDGERTRSELRNLKPMSPEQFVERFSELQLRGTDDRFSQIKSSLQELRRGLNEVTAPYNSTVNTDSTHNGEERLPCEFCATLVLPDDLVQHQTGCRPDLARYSPRPHSPPPIIPCEFCAAPLPLTLITQHQARCGRDAELLLPD